jgi:putative NADH-flavin reductase
MKIAVVGATGRTGLQVAKQALARGDEVIALARHPEALPRLGPAMASAAADVLDRAVLAEALAGADAIVSTLGIGASREPTVVYSDGTANVLQAMDAHGIRKLAVISAVPAGRAGHHGHVSSPGTRTHAPNGSGPPPNP